jgi:hypothetical protein
MVADDNSSPIVQRIGSDVDECVDATGDAEGDAG